MFRKKIAIPDHNISELCTLMDAEDAKETATGASNLEYYILWKRVEELIPKTSHGNWELEFQGSRLYLIPVK